MGGAALMARPKGRPKQPAKAEAAGDARVTIINLKGTQDQADWLDAIHRKTFIPKTTIVRLALAAWAEQNGHPPFPGAEGEE